MSKFYSYLAVGKIGGLSKELFRIRTSSSHMSAVGIPTLTF